MEDQINQWDTYQDFNIWLRLNKKGFKNSVCNEVAKWISLFKTDLIDRVINSLEVCISINNIIRAFTFFYFYY